MSITLSAFRDSPATFIGNHPLKIEPIQANETNATTKTISVKVQKEDNYTETITEAFRFTELSPASCKENLHLHRNSRGGYEILRTKNSPNDADLTSYYLPWKNGLAYAVRLDDGADFFATAKVNGCCVYVTGDRASPMVIHANYNPQEAHTKDRLFPPKQSLANLNPTQMGEVYTKHHFKQYTRFYGNLAHKLVDDGVLERTKPISVYDPEFYLARGGVATMFGVRKNGQWTFYFNLQKESENVTAELWPAIVGRMP